jgi:hypothetical protein
MKTLLDFLAKAQVSHGRVEVRQASLFLRQP